MSKYIVLVTLVFAIGCNGQTNFKESNNMAEARWYYHSYAMNLKACDRRVKEVQPLACNNKFLKSLKIGDDTIKIFFQAFDKDTSGGCSFRPLNLVGISVVRNKLYLPIYHAFIFDAEKDSVILERMKKQSLLLQKKVLGNTVSANSWLRNKAKRRENE